MTAHALSARSSGRAAAPGYRVSVADRRLLDKQRPRHINLHGQRAGWVVREGRERAALFEGDRVVDVGLLHDQDHASRALALNDRAQVVGISLRGRDEHAFVWQAGSSHALGDVGCPIDRTARSDTAAPQPLQASRARAINNAGQVVGRAATEDRVFGFVWSLETGLVDLSALQPAATPPRAWRIADALHIDDHGRILAVGVRDGRWHDVLLTPRPSAHSRPAQPSPFIRHRTPQETLHAHPDHHCPC